MNTISEIDRLSVSNASGRRQLRKYISVAKSGKATMTLLRWELFNVEIQKSGALSVSFEIDTKNRRDKLVQLKKLTQMLLEAGIECKLLLVIPDEIVHLFWSIEVLRIGSRIFQDQVDAFAGRLSDYYKNEMPACPSEVIAFSRLLKNPMLSKEYIDSYSLVEQSFDDTFASRFVSKSDFQAEKEFRKKIYAAEYDMSDRQAKEFAVRAFGLFAGETAVLRQMEQDNTYNNLVLLSSFRKDEVNKYNTLAEIKLYAEIPRIYLW